ncbi:MAG TPA: type II secretion system protein [Candidatus Hydrogenedentes bacterium]|jgi:prepilin-type N-terminal cleavage/methylation domain-containing protein|nr:type II secretion system protein [Candidatus Hydrogenedentota bacterium]HPK00646.1 type II secretion system protein [Candidatus Hydrogenedentota bacterium]
MRNQGFTLMELILVMAIIVIMTAIVYSSLTTVVNSTAMARAAAEETRLRQFLARSFETNFRSVYSDRTNELPAFQFIGVNDESSDGPMDSVRFCSTAPLMGGMALPGDLKEVRYEVMDSETSKLGLDFDGTRTAKGEKHPGGSMLESVEMPLIAGNTETLDSLSEAELTELAADPNYEAPHWSVPVRSMDLKYFDGADWLDEWDSLQFGRLPWCVHIRINFAKTEAQLKEEASERYDDIDDPDFELVIPIPAGLGVTEDGRALAGFSGQAARDALEQLEREGLRQEDGAPGIRNNIQRERSNR